MSDGFYRAFEERHRGSRELIKGRLAAYLPFVEPLLEVFPVAATIDLGCGRGEWLELLAGSGFKPVGVDLDKEMLKACLERGLQVEQGDALAYLSALPDESQAVVSAFHVVEHITFDQLRTLVSEALRVLKPGGLLIMETPNPENIVVATSNFYLDPTHQRPIPSMLLSFVAEYAGFARVKTLRLQERKELVNKDDVSLHDVFAGASPDYAVVAQKHASDDVLALTSDVFSVDYGLSLDNLLSRWDGRFERLEAKAQQAQQQLEQRIEQGEAKAQQAPPLSESVGLPLKSNSRPHLAVDMYVLGQGVKTGIYRVCDELFRRLAKRNEFDVLYLLRSSTQAASLDYLQAHDMHQEVVSENEANPAEVCDILLSPFGVAPSAWLEDQGVLQAHIIYDLIAIRRPDLFTHEASNEVQRIMDSLTPNTRVFAISEYTRQDLLDYRPDLSPDQVVVIPLAAGEQFAPCTDPDVIAAAKKRYSIPIEAQYVLSLATLEVRKNLNRVVDAFASYMNDHPESDLHLVLAGMSGWKLESLGQSLSNAGRWRDRIILTGFVEEADLSAIYSGATCFIYLSQHEGFGLPPLEAMACGTPVICANNSSLPEVVGDAGILIDANDVKAAAESISRICKSAQLHSELSSKGIERAKLFSWEKCEDIVTESLKQFATSKNATMCPAARGTCPELGSPLLRYSKDSPISLNAGNVRPVGKVRYATYLGYRDGDGGPVFPVHLPSKPVGQENWPSWVDLLPGTEGCRREEGGLRTLGQLKSSTAGQPLITYVTVVRNNQDTLGRTILSVQAQTYGNVEHIVLDGASSDGTLDIIRRYADRIDYYASEPDAGLYDALNKAIPLSRGQLICVLNSDDWLEPDAAQIAAKRLQECDGPLMLLTAARVADGKVMHDWRPAVVHPGSYFMCANDCHNAIYASKSTYELTGPYDSTYKIAADFKWIMSALDAGARFIYTTEPTVNYSLGGTSSDFLGHSGECMRVVQERFPALSKQEVRGLYHCFFIFSDPNKKIELGIPANYTTFLQQTLANHADDAAFVASMGWASIVKLNHPQDGTPVFTPQKLKSLKHKIAHRLKGHPLLYSFVRKIYIGVIKG